MLAPSKPPAPRRARLTRTPWASALLLMLPSLASAQNPEAAVPPAPQLPPATVVPLDLEMTPGLGESLPPPPPPPAPKTGAAPNGKTGADKAEKDKPKVRVPYLSETQRTQLKSELRDEILDTARRENWAQPETVPDWVRRVRFEGELLVRTEFDGYDRNNGLFVNYQEANRSGPVNITTQPNGQPAIVPSINSTEDRTLPRLRARVGLAYALSDPLSFNLRLSTGNTINPVSNNQTLGNSFNKLSFVVDRAYIHYAPLKGLAVDLGRGPNPFATGTDLIWDRDLSFDGLAVRYRYAFTSDRALRLASGFFSVENTDPNFPSNSLDKNKGTNKYLWGSQIDFRSDVFKEQLFRGGLGLYTFTKLEGERSSPCDAVSAGVACDTDDTRPGFLQKGNTLFQIRNTQPINPGDPDFQFFGLATDFTILSLATSFETPIAEGLRLALDVDAARNLAFDRGKITAHSPDNNLGACTPTGATTADCKFDGGRDAWQAQLRIGRPAVKLLNDWQVILGYRYVESDAVLDAFTDSDFHLGGTNAKGYYVGGSWGFARSAALSARYFGATEISSQQLGIDVWQLDVSVKF